ncbi:nifU-like protein 1, chloroplastic [Iris pallida]|uniref:NifU-like protein 1, chloroplastic n=1 Tax=Iris pallida TaxID=29817 RepID=A0AAX6DII1_IRIPA|nr:nifU-like protein 1, chloroplastic [Iris pallida]
MRAAIKEKFPGILNIVTRVLKEKFGEAVKDIRQVSDDLQSTATRVEVGTTALELIIVCQTIMRAAIKEKFPGILNIVFTSYFPIAWSNYRTWAFTWFRLEGGYYTIQIMIVILHFKS